MDVRARMKKYKERVDHHMSDYLDSKIEQAREISPLITDMYRHIKDMSVPGGKRVRGLLIYESFKALGGKESSAILDVSMAMELMHSYLLVHDDIMDQDELRRGTETIHSRYSKRYRKKNKSRDSEHYGICMGMIAGNILAVLSNEIIAEAKMPADKKVLILNEFTKIGREVNAGQMLDVYFEFHEDSTRHHLMKIHTYKTAKYTIEGPMHIGALLAGRNKRVLENISEYAIPIGIAFQLQDDILGMFGDQARTGKSVVSDLREGKKTLLIIQALKKAGPKQRRDLEKRLGNQNITVKDAELVRDIIIQTGAYEYNRKMLQKLLRKGIKNLNPRYYSADGYEFLTAIAKYFIHRDV